MIGDVLQSKMKFVFASQLNNSFFIDQIVPAATWQNVYWEWRRGGGEGDFQCISQQITWLLGQHLAPRAPVTRAVAVA